MPNKAEGKHPENALTAVKVRQVTTPGRYTDGNGLYLVVDSTGAKRWLLRILVHGKRRDIGLGGLALVSLAEARQKAFELRKIARDGGDPIAERDKGRKVVPTFRKAAEDAHEAIKASFRSEKHADQWINTLEQYAYPYIGKLRVDQVTTPDILKVLSPIWLSKAETARRLKQRLHRVFEHAKAAGHRTGENPASGVTSGLAKQTNEGNHHAALPYSELPGFMVKLRNSDEAVTSRLALELLILTATRTSEVLLAEWAEFDIAGKLWTIPKERMKAGREHRVPLTPRVVEILKVAKSYAGEGKYVFPGAKKDRPRSNMMFLQLLKRMQVRVTAHGFRSTFDDWAAETTHHAREVTEMALAHTIKSKVEAAYRRGDLLEKRTSLMSDWETFALSKIGPSKKQPKRA